MRKLFIIISAVVLSISLAACKKYEAEAGVYELYYMSGDFSMSSYDYYTIELKANGKAIVKSKANGQEYEAECTFDIENGKIILVTRNGLAKVTETYDYIDGEIQMLDVKLELNGRTYRFTAKFRRALEGIED